MSVYKKLQEARVNFHSKSLKKTGENKFAKYFYFELGDFLPAIQDVCHEVGIVGVCSFTADVATLKIVDADKPEDVIEFTSPMGSADLKGCHVVQNIGAVETYQRRYLWVTAMEIVEHDVLDATTGKDDTKAKASPKVPLNPGKGVITPNSGAGDELTEGQKQAMRDLAHEVKELLGEGKNIEAVEMMQGEELDIEHKRYFWSLLPSNNRTTINALTKK